jgi:hypothetical protein
MTTNNRNNKKRNFGDPSLTRTVHWRRVKNTAYTILDMAGIDQSAYNFDNICCYTCTGVDLQGNNVTYTAGKNKSCWVSDNAYTVFEVPAKSNTSPNPYEGWFFVLAQNTSFDYWIAGAMKYDLNVSQSKRYNKVVDNVTFKPLGQFTVSPEYTGATSAMRVTCKVSGKDCVFDTTLPEMRDFDHQGGRKRAYKTTENEILARLSGANYSQGHTVGGAEVKKYKKKSNKGKPRSGTRK